VFFYADGIHVNGGVAHASSDRMHRNPVLQRADAKGVAWSAWAGLSIPNASGKQANELPQYCDSAEDGRR
jgi:hypothetical protein